MDIAGKKVEATRLEITHRNPKFRAEVTEAIECRIMEPGEGEIALVYARPREKGLRPLKSFSVKLSVR